MHSLSFLLDTIFYSKKNPTKFPCTRRAMQTVYINTRVRFSWSVFECKINQLILWMCFKMKYCSSQFLTNLTLEIFGRQMLHVMLCTEMGILHWAVLGTRSDNPGSCKPDHSVMLPCPWLYITRACNLWLFYQLDFSHRTCISRLWLFQAWNLD